MSPNRCIGMCLKISFIVEIATEIYFDKYAQISSRFILYNLAMDSSNSFWLGAYGFIGSMVAVSWGRLNPLLLW